MGKIGPHTRKFSSHVIGPEVSKKLDIGTIPDLLILPIVGFNPTNEFLDEGDNIEPEVSEPIEAAAKLAAIETPLPELDPPDSKTFRPYGLRVCPPIELYPTGQGLQK